MDHRTAASPSAEDAELVASALAGDRAALAAIYDRYADRVHTTCVHMLRDRDEAADVCGEVFLTAFQRLGQLRDATRLRAWLFAITRHEVYRRTKRRARIELVEEVEEMDGITAASPLHDGAEGVDQAELAELLRIASEGLDARDRIVMELQLQGLDGDELAASLGTSTSTAYQQVHRMKERLGRSLGAVLVARQGREDCEELDRLLAGWDGTFDVLWRKRVARHVDRCDVCERRRKAVPAALFGGAAAAYPMVGAGAVSAAPASVRDRVLSGAQVSGASGRGRWRRDGFPPREPRRGVWSGAVVVAVVAVLAILLSTCVGGGDERRLISTGASTASVVTSSTTSTTTTTTTVVPGTSPISPSTTVAAPVEPAAPTTTAPAAAPPAPPDQPPVGSPPTTTTVTVPAGPAPTVTWEQGPSTVFHPFGAQPCGASTEFVARATDAERVELWWSNGPDDGRVVMSPSGGRWRGVLEPPAGVQGPLTLVLVAVDGTGRSGASTTRPAVVQPCPIPG